MMTVRNQVAREWVVCCCTQALTRGVLFACFGHILEKGKQTDPKTLQCLSTQIMSRLSDKLGLSVKLHYPLKTLAKKQNSAWFP